MMMKFSFIKRAAVAVVLVLSLNLLSACGGRPENSVVIAGSTSVQPYVEVLEEQYARLYPGNKIDIQGGGSSAGVTAVESGAADIGMSSRALKDAELGLWSVEIAKDGLAIIINPANPIDNLTLEQVRDIYAAKITDWGELGSASARIHLIAREEGSGTRDAFVSLVMEDVWITPRAIVQNSNGAVRQLVSADPYSIGFISMGLVDGPQFDDPVKALRLDGVEPTRENISNGGYRLFRPFLFVLSDPPTGSVQQFVTFALSEEGQRILEHEGLITNG